MTLGFNSWGGICVLLLPSLPSPSARWVEMDQGWGHPERAVLLVPNSRARKQEGFRMGGASGREGSRGQQPRSQGRECQAESVDLLLGP